MREQYSLRSCDAVYRQCGYQCAEFPLPGGEGHAALAPYVRFDDGHNVCIELPNGIDQGQHAASLGDWPGGEGHLVNYGSRGTT